MFKRILAVILALSLCFVFASCGGNANTANTEAEGESGQFTVLSNKPDDWDTNWTAYYEMDGDGNPVKLATEAAPEFVAGKYLAKGVVQKTADNNGTTEQTDDQGGEQTTNTDNQTVNATATNTTKFAADPFSDVPASVKGTTVEYLMCRQITDNDKAIVKGFEEKTGIKVKLTYAEYGGYGETVANRVAAGNAPDIINGERVAYPNALISLCEPLDVNTFKLEDDFWDYDSMSGAKIRGSYYGVNSKKSIYHDARMLMINVPLLKKILGADYATQSPRALWKAGKWNLEALYDLCTTIKDKGYMPLTYISQYDFALASGQDLVTFNGTKFVSNLSNADLRKSWEWISKFLNSEGYLETYNQNNFLAQKDVMFINTVYNCYNKNSIAGWASFEVDAVPVPGLNGVTNAPCDFRVYAIAKGAKNKVGAAYFLRYLLDNENYNPYEKSEATNANVWETAVYVSQQLPKTMEFSSSLLKYVSDTAEGQVRTALITSKQISTAFAKIENQVDNAVKRVNKSVLKVE
ncbi:MAG: extracellular solute-binding protein [Clostridia bacterium]|nr:extracellular solute-binding protein [Clostridia bacterium]